MNALADGDFSFRLELLGLVRARRGDRELDLGPARQQAVLALLAMRANRVVSRDELIDALWDGDPPASAVNRVHSHVSALRRVLGSDPASRRMTQMLTSVRPGYRLALAPGHLDIQLFHDQLSLARAAGHKADAVRALETALRLWNGTPLAGVPGPWAEAERTRLAELRLKAIEDRAQAKLDLGAHMELTAELAALVIEQPLRERLRALLMQALFRSGRQADALAVYAETRHLLIEQLGIEPGAELQRVHHEILNSPDLPGPGAEHRRVEITQVEVGQVVRQPGCESAENIPPRQLPAVTRCFVGRQAELESLNEWLTEGTPGLISVVDGGPGTGKTALAVHGAHLGKDRFPDGQLYVDLRGYDPHSAPVTPGEALSGFLVALAAPPESIPANLDAQAALYRSLVAGRRILVVLDNARNTEQIRPLLPGTPTCRVIVTSRSQLTGLIAVQDAHLLHLDLFSPAEAVRFLALRLGAERVNAEPRAVEELVARCSRLPLALAVVTTRAAARPWFTLAALAAELRTVRAELDGFALGDPTADVRAAFSWSYQSLSPAAARLFRLVGLLRGEKLSVRLGATLSGLPVVKVKPLLAELSRANLLVEHEPGHYTLHRLLRVYALEQARAIDSCAERLAVSRRLARSRYATTDPGWRAGPKAIGPSGIRTGMLIPP